MNKALILTLCLMGFSVPCAVAATGFAPEIAVIEKKDIVKLSDDQLVDTYVETLVELEASKVFHQTNGFGPKDYKDFKELIKFRFLLLMEIHSRNLEIPQLDRL